MKEVDNLFADEDEPILVGLEKFVAENPPVVSDEELAGLDELERAKEIEEVSEPVEFDPFADDEEPEEVPAPVVDSVLDLSSDVTEFRVEDQDALFDLDPDWRKEWAGMPEYDHKDLRPFDSVHVHFRNAEDKKAFLALVGPGNVVRQSSIWYPKLEPRKVSHLAYKGDRNPVYPVYIISKGRADTRKTSKALEKMGVPYHIVIEPQEYDDYAAVIDPAKILQLPFSNLGQGSIPARNWVWEHSISIGAERHWIMDDNIASFHRFHNNAKVMVNSGDCFRIMEEFTDRYTNVGISGPNYFMFAVNRDGASIPPYTLNTRIYSCILIRNDIPYRWRGRYNEDTDLSLRALKDGWCTVLFNAFLALKQTTMTMKGGNTDELYKDDGRLKMAQSLVDQHPDVCKVTEKWGRYQHHVDYRPFKKNTLRLKEGVTIDEKANDFGLSIGRVTP